MTYLTTLKILGGTAIALAFSSTAKAGPIESLNKRVKCVSCEQLDLSGRPNIQNHQSTIFQGGNDDSYQGGNAEATSPRAALTSLSNVTTYANRPGINGLTRDYDELHSNEFFLETINVPNAATMKNGWLVFSLKSNGDSLDHNDNMYFGNFVDHTNLGPTDSSKYRSFSSRVNQFLTKSDSQGLIFTQDSATGAYYARLDRVKLYNGTETLLDQIKQDGFMDMVVQDDTGIDYVAIIACVEGKPGVRPTPRKIDDRRRRIERPRPRQQRR